MSAHALSVGIDVSKATLDVAILPGTTAFQVPNTRKGWTQLISRLDSEPSPCLVLEATGAYHLGVTLALAAVGMPPAVINPQRIHAFRRSEGIRAKTDRHDAVLLARFAQQKQPAPTPILPENVRQLKELMACHTDLVTMITMEKNRLQVASEVTRPIHQTVITDLTRQLKHVDQAIKELIAADSSLVERDRILQSAPGVGWYVSAMVLSGLPELGSCSRQVAAALAGLAPHPRDSGLSTGHRRIGGGRTDVRRALYLMAHAASIWNPLMRQHVQALRQRSPRKVALIACARRMLGILNAMLRDGITWQETTVATTFVPREIG